MLSKNPLKQRVSTLMAAAISAAFMMQVSLVQADERESLEQLRATTTNLIDLLVQEGVLNKDKADAIVKKATADAASQVKKAKAKEAADALALQENPELAGALAPKQDPKSVRVQYVPEHVKKEMRDEIQKEVMAKLNYKAGTRLGMPEWIDRIEWVGSTRLRYQFDQFGEGNELPVAYNESSLRQSNIENTTESRNRLRIRQLLGANVTVNDWLTGGIRLTTGNLRDPGTANQDLELSDAKFTVGLDRAYLKAKLLPNLTVYGGRYAKPWFSTDLIFDDDLPFDGIAVNYMPTFSNTWSGFATVAAVPLDEINSSDTRLSRDKWMYGAQAGIEWKIPQKASFKLGLAYYDYKNVEGVSNGTSNGALVGSSVEGPFDGSLPAFRQKGNNTFDINENNGLDSKYGLASKFQIVNITGQVDYAKFDPIHVTLLADYAKNIGFDQQEILSRTGNLYEEETDAYNIRLTVGMPKMEKAHDWQVFGAYKRLEADSVVDGYTDQNFRLGGTDAKGWIMGGSYGLDKNTWITARWFTADEVTGVPRQSSTDRLPFAVDSFIIDLNAKF